MALLAGLLAALAPLRAAAGVVATTAPARPPVLESTLPTALPAGAGRLTYWGLAVYDASLWVTPGFRREALGSHAFALELHYLRAFSAADIARRSIEEMRRAGSFSPQQAQRWGDALRQAFPDVKKGDRILGVHRPGVGARFFYNGSPSGEIADPQFARLFFAIWLGPATSEPALRAALLEGTVP